MKDFGSTFISLSSILRKHSAGLSIKTDDPGHLYVEVPALATSAKPSFFGAVQTKKSYVSYHLMPVYEDPALLNDLSVGLLARMQGKSCFNFTAPDPVIFQELDSLSNKGAAPAKQSKART